MALMDEFQKADSLYQERKNQGKIQRYERPIPEARESKLRQFEHKRPRESVEGICEYWIVGGGCKILKEAERLGLTKLTFICQGMVPPVCSVRKKTEAGMTVVDLFNK